MVKELSSEAREIKECVAELTLENRLLKKHNRGWGRRLIRYLAEEKLEIIRYVPRRTFYRWYDRHLHYGEDGHVERTLHPFCVWIRASDRYEPKLSNSASSA